MGIGVRVHFFHEDGSIARIPHARFDRLFDEDSEERMPEYAGRRVRCAMSFLEVEGRRPLTFRHTSWFIVPFDEEGKLDCQEKEEGDRLAMQSISYGALDLPENVLDLSPKLYRKQYREKFLWEPSQEQVNQVVEDVFAGTK